MLKKMIAEFIGTFMLVFGGCGSAVLSATFPELGIGFIGVAFAFGFSVLVMAYSIGRISGGHFNPAVTLGLCAGSRFPISQVIPYILAQVVGGVVGASVLYFIATGKPGFDATVSGFASNGYGAYSPDGYSLISVILCEIVLTALFVIIIHGVTDKAALSDFSPIAIGLALVLIHLISIPVSNTSVNPARSTAVAIFQGTWAISQLWVFWLAPISGGILGGLISRYIFASKIDGQDH